MALTTVVRKSFEKLVLAYLKDITGPLLEPLQFAYRANRSVDDAVNMGLHYILEHLDKSGTYVRILFVDFSSAFNTIIPTLLQIWRYFTAKCRERILVYPRARVRFCARAKEIRARAGRFAGKQGDSRSRIILIYFRATKMRSRHLAVK